MDSRTTTYLTVAGVTLAAGVVAYAAYFDYKRRNDNEFRKKLRKQKKKVDKSIAESKLAEAEEAAASATSEITPAMIEEALEQIKLEPTPQSPEDKETYFMQQVSVGEQLSVKGPDFYMPAAMSFYRALRVYPSPVELIVIYQKTIPEPIFKIIMEMTNLDVRDEPAPIDTSTIHIEQEDEETSPTSGGPPSEASSQEWDKVKNRVAGYYEAFPPKSFNVEIETRNGRKVMVLLKDVAEGETIYSENPIVAALDEDIQVAGTHCAHCFRVLETGKGLQLPAATNPLGSVFCSTQCVEKNLTQSHNLLFTLENPLPSELAAPPPAPEQLEARARAEANFSAYLKKQKRAVPQLVARFIARQVGIETTKMLKGVKEPTAKDDFTDAESGEYLLADHVERLRYVEVQPPAEELSLFSTLLSTALPGLEQFITDERHSVLCAKMAYNGIGVVLDGGRDDKPSTDARPEDIEKSRTPLGTNRQVGTAFYTLSSYLSHSCNPSVKPVFTSGTNHISIVATRDLKAGDELSMAYVDVAQHEGESTIDCRRRRRIELVRGWKFACMCERCEAEAAEMTAEEKQSQPPEPEQVDESKVEMVAQRVDSQETGDVE